MDLGVGTPPEVNSIHHEEEHLPQSPDLGRKRKLQLEQLVLPMSKRKFRHQRSNSSSFDRGSPTAHHLIPNANYEDYLDETGTVPDLHEAPEQLEGSSSHKDISSSCLLEASDSTIYLGGREETSPKIFVPQFETPASPGSPQGVAFKNNLYSLDSRVVVKNNKLPASGVDDGDDEPDCQLPVSDEGDDEYVKEEFLDWPIEDEVLSCDNVGLNTPGLSSTRWSIKQDALPGAARPTIDQEFEQYFSMFML